MSSSKPGDDRLLAGAIRYATTGVRSREDLRTYLKRRGAASGTIARVLDACTARGLLDDHACARLWAEHWARLGYAQSVIYQRLSEKAIDADAIEDAIKTIARTSDDEARARAVLARHLGRGRQPRSRLARTLASRGFDADVIERVLYEAFSPPQSN